MTGQTLDLPPPESLGYWEDQIIDECENVDVILIEAWQAGHKAGAEQELDACCEWARSKLSVYSSKYADDLRDFRRPHEVDLKLRSNQLLDRIKKRRRLLAT